MEMRPESVAISPAKEAQPCWSSTTLFFRARPGPEEWLWYLPLKQDFASVQTLLPLGLLGMLGGIGEPPAEDMTVLGETPGDESGLFLIGDGVASSSVKVGGVAEGVPSVVAASEKNRERSAKLLATGLVRACCRHAGCGMRRSPLGLIRA